MIMFIETETTPNPSTLKFLPGERVMASGTRDFASFEEAEASPLASAAPGAPPELCMIVDRAVAFEPERRYPDVVTMQQDVRALLGGKAPPYAASRVAAGDLPNPGAAAPAYGGPGEWHQVHRRSGGRQLPPGAVPCARRAWSAAGRGV